MSTTTAQSQFAAELVTMVVAAAGLVLVALRGQIAARRGPGRLALAAGFLAIGTVAFLHGSGLVTTNPHDALSVGRLVGAAALLAGSTQWAAGERTRLALQLGALVGAAAALSEIAGLASGAVDALLVVGGVTVAVALLGAARLSVAAAVAAGAASTLLLVVLVLAVALGSVITSSVQRNELDQVTSQARAEVGQVAGLSATAVKDARFVAADLAGYFRASTPNPLVEIGAGASPAAATAALADRLRQVTGLYPLGSFAYADPSGAVVASTARQQASPVPAVLRDPLIVGQRCSGDGHGSVVVTGTSAWVAAAYPECLAGQDRLLGTVISIRPLDSAYLAGRLDVESGVSLALATPAAVVATAGPQPGGAALEALALGAMSQGSTTRASGGRVLSVQPVPDASGHPAASLILSLPSTALAAARDRLFRTLSLIALGGTALALVLAALIGDRITVGIRTLTAAAKRVQAGDTTTRAGLETDDEVGVLGAAFDSMVVAIEEQTIALQGAADDETRLRNRLEAVVAGMGDALVALDAGGRITDFNRAAEELTGLLAADALGAPAAQLLDLRDDGGAPLDAGMTRPGPARWAVIATLRPVRGPAVPVAVSSGALHGPAGEVAGAVWVLRDLRREHELERMKTEFLSRVGHELRTPLTGILGYADILVRRPVPAERAAAWHEEILRSAKRLVRIVEMLEFFATSGAGRVLLRPEPLDVRELVDDVTGGWRERMPEGTELLRRVARGTPPVVADRRWVALAVDELIDNAVKFSPGGGRVRVSARPAGNGEPHAGGWVDIEVSDRGKGMTAEERAGAFGEFTQGDESDTRSYGGLGLGLALVRRVVESHGGSVSCTSSPGRGSTFTIRLPAVAPN
ncbi:HAMP domain-containing protein [Acidiferrimicrobium sp. IK]|uniref:ATP-binding protein n=1 Tax=Acidiferrimicrobium sp. IK TaxID=2871700 RepID=UPI0021CB46E7|nr:ATP-binding protein [Acidiferrimicrobium sp. IK]MCU4185111.1 HAMP domain-containing protein [Acidiferrimicrobium sp. IK]